MKIHTFLAGQRRLIEIHGKFGKRREFSNGCG
jgi:hypothetical protein